jgi:hypothetical protein
MNLSTRILHPDDELQYETLVLSRSTSLIYASSKWRAFLTRLRPDFEPAYFGVFDGKTLVGAMPGMVASGPYGSVYNSMPFYGSHGGIICAENMPHYQVAKELFGALEEFASRRGLVSSTVISNPLQSYSDVYSSLSGATATDDRIGQVIALPSDTGNDIIERLMTSFHQKTRNAVRKGLSGGFKIVTDNSEVAFRNLHSIHQENMARIGGSSKSWEVFASLREVLTPGRDYELYVATQGSTVVSAVLVLFYNCTAEYFTPVTVASYRQAQPLSALILHAMTDAVRRGLKFWNWGGTWLSQSGVYQFKARWGTGDMPYRYYTREYSAGRHLRQISRHDLLLGYPMVYVLPFGLSTK